MGRLRWKALAIGVLLLGCATIFGFSQLFQQQSEDLESLLVNPAFQRDDLLNSILYPNSHLLKQEELSPTITEYYFESEDSPELVMAYLFDRLQAQGWLYSGWFEDGMSFNHDRADCKQQMAELHCYTSPSSGIHVSAQRERGASTTGIYFRIESVKQVDTFMNDS